MQEELSELNRNGVWDLVSNPKDKRPSVTKWVFKNRSHEKGEVVRNNAKLVAQGYIQQEGIDYIETFASIATLEAICILLSFFCL